MNNRFVKRQVIIILISALVVLGVLAAKQYAVTHPLWVTERFRPASVAVGNVLTGLFGLVRFSVGEIFLYILLIALPIGLAVVIWRVVSKKTPPIVFFRVTSLLCAAVAFFLLVFYGLYGISYQALPLSYSLNMSVSEYSVSQLRETTESLLAGLNELSYAVDRSAAGTAELGDFEAFVDMAGDSYASLAGINTFFSGIDTRRVKPVIASVTMSDFGITGIFCPFTGEANINKDVPDSSIPFTICHELAHSIGVLPENEANFAAFLACRASPHDAFKYSGYLSGFIYCYNALYKEDPNAARELAAKLSDGALSDIRARSAYWAAHEKKLTTVATSVNDSYLKAMSQEDGVKSYGAVVDLLISDYLAAKGK